MNRLCVLVILFCSGCTSMRWWAPDPFSDRARSQLTANVTKDQLIAHLNANIRGDGQHPGLSSWRSQEVSIKIPKMPPLPATLSVSAPRGLRLNVLRPFTNQDEVDLGSNDECFWCWVRDFHPQEILTCHHEDFGEAASSMAMPIPFQPDWLMEVLGVIPFDAAEFEMERSRDGRTVDLVAERMSPQGETVIRTVTIDARHGVVLEHRLTTKAGRVIARAALSRYDRDPVKKLVFPRMIALEWPEANMHLTMTLRSLELNPPHTDERMWEVLSRPDCRQVDLGAMARVRDGGSTGDDMGHHRGSPAAFHTKGPAWPPTSPSEGSAKTRRPRPATLD